MLRELIEGLCDSVSIHSDQRWPEKLGSSVSMRRASVFQSTPTSAGRRNGESCSISLKNEMFQSTPTSAGRRNKTHEVMRKAYSSFNPLRPALAGEIPVSELCVVVGMFQSTPTSAGRRNPGTCGHSHWDDEFQSTPTSAGRRNLTELCATNAKRSFNPLRPALAGEIGITPSARCPYQCFNPLRPALAGEIRRWPCCCHTPFCFNPLRPALAGEIWPEVRSSVVPGVSIHSDQRWPEKFLLARAPHR